jgi:hypothetical protein
MIVAMSIKILGRKQMANVFLFFFGRNTAREVTPAVQMLKEKANNLMSSTNLVLKLNSISRSNAISIILFIIH